jgi:large conductance mechanosensitive channel
MIGNLINAIITFLITAVVLFFIIKAFNKFDDLKKKEEEPAPEEEPAVPEDIQLLTEIRDLLKK